jgi:hypothetical protein
MSYEVALALSFSLIVPAILALMKYSSMNVEYHPFFYFIWAGLLNECISMFANYYFRSNAINSNIYVLIEAILILWLFRRWKLFKNYNIFYVLIFIYLAAWVAENLFISRITFFNSYFRILYSFGTVLMAIQLVNQLIVRQQKSMTTNATFIISIGFIIYYTYKILVEVFWVYGLNKNSEFRENVYNILHFINLFCNLIYALAIVWIPRKKEFIRQSF